MKSIKGWALVAAVVLAAAAPYCADACTGITFTASDGSVVYGRTMELGNDLVEWGLVVVPRGTSYVGATPWGGPGAKWSAKYAFTGVNGYGLPTVIDGVNEAGLAIGSFMFTDYAEYQPATEKDAGKTIASSDFADWVLSNYATVAEMKEGLPKIKVTAVVYDEPGWEIVPPIHWLVVDESGEAVVVEYVGGELAFHDNPIGVITNSPAFDWHLTNLKNYVELSRDGVPPRELCGEMVGPMGRGSGMLGLPGDFTPPSRFIRAAYIKDAVIPVNNATDGIVQVFHVLNQFDIPRGLVGVDQGGRKFFERTDWTSAVDLKNRRYYIHTAATRRIHMIDLMRSPLDAGSHMNISLPQEEEFVDLTPPTEK